jgi:hypothetical protein
MTLFKRWFKIIPIERAVNRLTIDEWRADRAYVASAAGILRDPRVQQMLDTCANSSPSFDVLPLNTPLQDRAVLQARQEGYVLALANFAALGQEQALHQSIQSTFSPEEKSA